MVVVERRGRRPLRREVRLFGDTGDAAVARGVVLERLRTQEPSLPLPELVSLTRDRALVVTRLVAGEPLSWEWAGSLTGAETTEVASQRGGLLGRGAPHLDP